MDFHLCDFWCESFALTLGGGRQPASAAQTSWRVFPPPPQARADAAGMRPVPETPAYGHDVFQSSHDNFEEISGQFAIAFSERERERESR